MASNKKNEQLIAIDEVEEKIYIIRGEKIMLDSDLAVVYGVETRVLNQSVKRNLNRFPDDFMFQLSKKETDELRDSSQIVMSSMKHRGASYRPYAFTEHGAVMLASILKSQTAIEASIQVVRAFVKMRSLIALHEDLAKRIEKLEKSSSKHSRNFVSVSQLLKTIFSDPKYSKRKIGFVEEKKGKTKK